MSQGEEGWDGYTNYPSFETERHNVGEGWQTLVANLHRDLLELDPAYQVTQIKEKFGGLRYYIATTEGLGDVTKNQMYNLTVQAETESLKTCEQCGENGRPRKNRSWIKTWCDRHAGAVTGE